MALVTSIMRTHQILSARVDATLAPFNLTFARFEVLMLLDFSRAGRLPLGKIGQRLQVHPASVTNAIDRLVSIASMVLLDWRYALFFWRDARAAAIVTAVAVAALLAADVAGIATGIFLRGDNSIATGILIAPHLPIEEPIFLVFLVLLTAVAYTGTVRILEARAGLRR